MNKIGRNQTCPCGSGRKFKSCCLRKFQSIKIMESPFLETPFAIQTLVFVDDEPIQSDVSSYWPICVIGKTEKSVTFVANGPEMDDSEHVVRLGFCNKEYRPLVQIRSDLGIFELRGNDILKPGPQGSSRIQLLTSMSGRTAKLEDRVLLNFWFGV